MATTDATSTAVRAKEFHFPVTVDWLGERRVGARAEGKPAIEITAPPVFGGTDPPLWSPEEFLVASAASCLAVTFTGLAARAGLTYTKLKVDGDGVVGSRADGHFGFTRLLLRLELDTDPTREAHARERTASSPSSTFESGDRSNGAASPLRRSADPGTAALIRAQRKPDFRALRAFSLLTGSFRAHGIGHEWARNDANQSRPLGLLPCVEGKGRRASD